jgi:hypothetical protein
MFDLLIGLALVVIMLRIAERMPERKPVPVPIVLDRARRGRQ